MSPRATTALIFLIAGLLTIVVLVGLAQRILDATGVAVALSSVLTGIVGGTYLRGRTSNKNGDRHG
jgi:hypothetical protein